MAVNNSYCHFHGRISRMMMVMMIIMMTWVYDDHEEEIKKRRKKLFSLVLTVGNLKSFLRIQTNGCTHTIFIYMHTYISSDIKLYEICIVWRGMFCGVLVKVIYKPLLYLPFRKIHTGTIFSLSWSQIKSLFMATPQAFNCIQTAYNEHRMTLEWGTLFCHKMNFNTVYCNNNTIYYPPHNTRQPENI